MASNKTNPSRPGLISALIRDESGAELVEMALVMGLIALLCIASMKGISVSLTQRWNDLLGVFSDNNA